MNLLFSCIGRRGYIADYFRESLDRSDRIIGTSNTSWTAGFIACDASYLLPDIDKPGYIPVLIDVCRQEKIDVLLSFFDLDVCKISRHMEEFRAAGVTAIVPSSEISSVCFDKYKTSAFLQQHGFGSPSTFVDLELVKQALQDGSLHFPLVIKPRYGFGSKNLFYARNMKELEVFFDYAPDMLVQETLQGDEYHLDILADLHGRAVKVIPKRKIAMRSGEIDQAMITDNAGLEEFAFQLADTMGAKGHAGPLDVDLFMDGDEITVLEMNPRFGGGYPLSHMAGANFPELILKMARGESVASEAGVYDRGVIMMKTYAVVGGDCQKIISNPVNKRDGLA